MKVLFADDDLTNALLYTSIFDFNDIEYIYAQNGTEALQLFNKHTDLDLVILDIRMPGINGINLSKLIREKNKDIPIIFATAYDDNILSELKTINYQNILFKPFCEYDLIQSITKYNVAV